MWEMWEEAGLMREMWEEAGLMWEMWEEAGLMREMWEEAGLMWGDVGTGGWAEVGRCGEEAGLI